MKKKDKHDNKEILENEEKDLNEPGYPYYPTGDDVYEAFKKEAYINPEVTTSELKAAKSNNALRQEALDKKLNLGGKDLDVPGAELDDEQEAIGEEDEENNYYSLEGDKHED